MGSWREPGPVFRAGGTETPLHCAPQKAGKAGHDPLLSTDCSAPAASKTPCGERRAARDPVPSPGRTQLRTRWSLKGQPQLGLRGRLVPFL